jgi:hypothetical protein
MKRVLTFSMVLVFGTFVAAAQAGSKGNSSQHSSSHNSSSNNCNSHCDHNSDHCHDSCHDSCHNDHCNKPPKEYMGGSKNGPPGTPENPFPPKGGHGPVVIDPVFPKPPITTVGPTKLGPPLLTQTGNPVLPPRKIYPLKPITTTTTSGQIPTLGTGFRGLAGAVGTEVGKGVTGVLDAAGDVVGGAANAAGSVLGGAAKAAGSVVSGAANAVGDVASGIGSALSDLNPF